MDAESDNDNQTDYEDEDEDNLQHDEPMPNPDPNPNLNPNQLQPNVVPNVVPKVMVAKKVQDNETKKKEFGGNVGAKNDWVSCGLCDRYYPKTMFLPNAFCCAHCWGWINSANIDLTNCAYNGPSNTIDEIKNFLIYTYPAHDSNLCKNVECVYNRITEYKNSNSLHMDLCVGLGFVKPKKEKLNSNTSEDTLTNTHTNPDEFNIKKKGYVKFNYKASSISI